MDRLDPKLEDKHSGTEIVSKKKAEYKFLGKGKRPFRGMHLWGLDLDKGIVYKIPIVKRQQIDLTKKETSTSKTTINPNHPTVWAINAPNAMKKFVNLKFKV